MASPDATTLTDRAASCYGQCKKDELDILRVRLKYPVQAEKGGFSPSQASARLGNSSRDGVEVLEKVDRRKRIKINDRGIEGKDKDRKHRWSWPRRRNDSK